MCARSCALNSDEDDLVRLFCSVPVVRVTLGWEALTRLMLWPSGGTKKLEKQKKSGGSGPFNWIGRVQRKVPCV